MLVTLSALAVAAAAVSGCSGKTEGAANESGASNETVDVKAARAQCASTARGAVDAPHNRKELGERMAGRWLFCIGDSDSEQSTAREHAGIEMTAAGDWWFLRLENGQVVREGGVENGGQWAQTFGGSEDPPADDTTKPITKSLYLMVASGGTWAGAEAFESGPRRFVYTPNVEWHAAFIGP